MKLPRVVEALQRREGAEEHAVDARGALEHVDAGLVPLLFGGISRVVNHHHDGFTGALEKRSRNDSRKDIEHMVLQYVNNQL